MVRFKDKKLIKNYTKEVQNARELSKQMIKKCMFIFSCMMLFGCLTKPLGQDNKMEIKLFETGLVKFNYRYGIAENTIINWIRLKASVIEHCQKIGYFGLASDKKVQTICDSKFSNEICKEWWVEISYQCS